MSDAKKAKVTNMGREKTHARTRKLPKAATAAENTWLATLYAAVFAEYERQRSAGLIDVALMAQRVHVTTEALAKMLANPEAWDLRAVTKLSMAMGARLHLGLSPRPLNELEKSLDQGIAAAVIALRTAGIETFESCQGGDGHAYPEPTVRFHGNHVEGYRAITAAMNSGLRVAELRRVWPMNDGELTGPWWEVTFVGPLPVPDVVKEPA